MGIDEYKFFQEAIDLMSPNFEIEVLDKKLDDIPEYKQLSKMSVLLDRYGKAAQLSYELGEAMSSLYRKLRGVKEIKREIKGSSLVRTLQESLLTSIERNTSSMESYLEALKAKKEGVDAQARYYSSVQYILGSPRLEGYN